MFPLLAIAGFTMAVFPVSRFWDRQAGDNTFELASSPPIPMNGLVRQQNGLAPRLLAEELRGIRGEPVRLGLTLAGSAEGGVVLIGGLAPGMSLSNGSPTSADKWQVLATDLANTWIGPPQDFVGVAKLIAELQLPDGTIAHRVYINVEWISATAASLERVASKTNVPMPGKTSNKVSARLKTPAAHPELPQDDQAPGREVISVARLTGAKPNQEATDEPAPERMSQSQCDYRACASAYRSFRESDCTYQPRRGTRRVCEKGL